MIGCVCYGFLEIGETYKQGSEFTKPKQNKQLVFLFFFTRSIIDIIECMCMGGHEMDDGDMNDENGGIGFHD